MILHTTAHCIADPPCEWAGTTDKSAEKHVRETGHATVVETIPVRENGAPNGKMDISEAVPDLTPEPPLSTPSKRGARMKTTPAAPGGEA